MIEKTVIYLLGLTKLAIFVAFFIGWVMNLAITFQPGLSNREMACRIGGVFLFPAGGIMGYMEPQNPQIQKQ